MQCKCGFVFETEGFRNFDMKQVGDRKIIICPRCKREYEITS